MIYLSCQHWRTYLGPWDIREMKKGDSCIIAKTAQEIHICDPTSATISKIMRIVISYSEFPNQNNAKGTCVSQTH